MKKLVILITTVALAASISGCDVIKQAQGAYNLTSCEYDFNSLSNFTVGGVEISGGSLNLMELAKLTSLLTLDAKSIPLDMTVNLDVTNPNTSPAAMNRLQYILNIDDVELTHGTLDQTIYIAAGDKSVLPLQIGVDLKSLLSGDTGNAVVKAIKNIAGIGDSKTKVTVQLKPTFTVGSIPFTPPSYIPVSFDLGE